MKTLLTISIAIFHNIAFAQNFTLRNIFQSNKEMYDSAIFEIKNPLQNSTLGALNNYTILNTSYSKKGDTVSNEIVYKIYDTTCAFIADGYGHEIILIPNDTLTIRIKPRDFKQKLNNKFICPWMFEIEYYGKNKFMYSIYDSLAYHTGPLHTTFIPYLDNNDSSTTFFNLNKSKMEERMFYLYHYCLNHNIDNKIKTLVEQEIKNAFLFNLLSGYEKTNNNCANYLETLNDINFKDEKVFFKTYMLSALAISYTRFYQNELNQNEPFSDERLLKTYISIKNNNTGNIEDFLLASHLGNFANKNNIKFDSLFTDYKAICINKCYYNYIDSIYKIAKRNTKITLLDALETIVYNVKGKKSPFSSLLKNKPVLIDCWASWCGPCIAEMKSSKELEHKYKGKIDFIYLSFDRSKDAWKTKSTTLGISESNFYLRDGFKSKFAFHFNIASIPRYILFNANGKLITFNAPRPSKKLKIEKLLNKVIE